MPTSSTATYEDICYLLLLASRAFIDHNSVVVSLYQLWCRRRTSQIQGNPRLFVDLKERQRVLSVKVHEKQTKTKRYRDKE